MAESSILDESDILLIWTKRLDSYKRRIDQVQQYLSKYPMLMTQWDEAAHQVLLIKAILDFEMQKQYVRTSMTCGVLAADLDVTMFTVDSALFLAVSQKAENYDLINRALEQQGEHVRQLPVIAALLESLLTEMQASILSPTVESSAMSRPILMDTAAMTNYLPLFGVIVVTSIVSHGVATWFSTLKKQISTRPA
jgi:hypothetical protein